MIGYREGWEENLSKAVMAIKSLTKASYVNLTLNSSGLVNLFAYPNDDQEEKRELVNTLTHLVGKLDKSVSGSTISLKGEKDGISVEITNYDKCEIVGFYEEEVPETITTGHMVKRKVMVSDCELKQGKYSGKQIVINKEETANV